MDRPPFDFAAEDYPLAPETYYRVGGPAELALKPRTAEEAVAAYQWMRSQPERRLILGRGSNVLISDAGFPGIVLFTGGFAGIAALGQDRFCVEAGVDLDRLVRDVILPNNYEGTGALTGIPGSVGGAIFMNAGTVNGSICQLIESVDLLTRSGPVTVTMNPGWYGYRSQTFAGPDDLIVRGAFRFTRSEMDQKGVYQHYLRRRKQNQPQGFCCGSVFKNPPNDHAGRLIEACGLKGVRRGGAVISPRHANFIMNEQNATFEDIFGLIELCKVRVHETFGITLEEEVRIIR
jgi:UDP-N-acetylmuramate dehydrogenase